MHVATRAVLCVLLFGAATACSSDDDAGACIGAETGDVTIREGVDVPLPGGGSAGIGATNLDEDPPTVTLVLGDATEAERQSAVDMEVGDVFTAAGASYELVGACADRAWVNPTG